MQKRGSDCRLVRIAARPPAADAPPALTIVQQFTEAIAELQRAKQNPNARLKAMNLLGQCYTEKGMLDLAVKQFQDAQAAKGDEKDRLTDLAKKKLQEVVDNYEGSKAAKEAQELLDKK